MGTDKRAGEGEGFGLKMNERGSVFRFTLNDGLLWPLLASHRSQAIEREERHVTFEGCAVRHGVR